MHTLKGEMANRRVWLDGKELLPNRSQKMWNHSPDGFAWGYSGSGPAQLALAIMLELTGEARGYQDFKWKVIAEIPPKDFEINFEIQGGKKNEQEI